MKHELGEVCKFSQRDGWYIWLERGKYLSNSGKPFDFNGSDENHEEKIKQIIFPTQELAEQTLNKYNNMETKRDYAALKQEGIDKDLCPNGYIYLGKGDRDYTMSKDWGRDNICRLFSDKTLDHTGWDGNSDSVHYCIHESIWNKKFPNEKKPITLDEIKSQLAEAKKLIGKKVKRINSPRKEDDVAFTVLDVSFNVDFDKFKDVGPRSKEFLKEFGYIIYLHGKFSGVPIFGIFSEKSIKVVEDVEVVLKSSYTAILSDFGIKVGCQTFPLDIIDKLVEARKQLA
jgi:hypothetical protein